MKWKYKSIKFTKRSFLSGQVDLSDLDKKLNDLGSHGWELININMLGGITAFFKRQA